MSLEYETRQQNSALTALKQRAAPPALTDQKPNVLYTMPVQTVEQLEEVLQQTLALQKTIQASMAALATKESLEPLATAEQLHQWLEQTQALNQKTHRAMGEILSEMREEHKRDGRQRDEFTRELSEIRTTFQKDTQEAIASLRKWIPFIIMSSAAAAVPVCILMHLVDTQNLLREETSLASFTAGFKLAWGLSKELEADGLYSFDEEETDRICRQMGKED